MSTNRYKLRHLASEGNRRAAQLTQWLNEPEPLLATILLGSNFASIGAATLSATLVSQWIVDKDLLEIGLIIEAVLLTLFILLFCELGPKALAARYSGADRSEGRDSRRVVHEGAFAAGEGRNQSKRSVFPESEGARSPGVRHGNEPTRFEP